VTVDVPVVSADLDQWL
jgi:hypothetical protein